MKLIASLLRITLFAVIAYLLFEFIIDSGDESAYDKHPMLGSIYLGLLGVAVFIEIIIGIINQKIVNSLDDQAKERYKNLETKSTFGKLYTRLLDSRAIEEEDEIILDHNYDGIKELDNNLPPWWVYMFYITIFFAIFYLAKYELFDGDSTTVEYEKEVAKAELEIEEYKRNNPDMVDASTVELLTDASDLNKGKEIFDTNCAVCHKNDGGGGIGPNLTDEHWILGGGIKNVFTTISEGGRPGKGMIPWKQDLSPYEIAQVGSYLLGFQGTTPAAPKAPEGEIWVEGTEK